MSLLRWSCNKEEDIMKHIGTILCVIIVMLGSLFIGSTYHYYSPFYNTITEAIAVIHPTKGNTVSGIASFSQRSDGLHISARLVGLTPGNHGFHIHEFGDCACDDATCAGDHFNPTDRHHGAPNVQDRHVGDLGNLRADAQGNAVYEYVDTHATLNGPRSIIGRSVIIHAQEDDYTTQPTGNAGARLGCGVIGIAKKGNG